MRSSEPQPALGGKCFTDDSVISMPMIAKSPEASPKMSGQPSSAAVFAPFAWGFRAKSAAEFDRCLHSKNFKSPCVCTCLIHAFTTSATDCGFTSIAAAGCSFVFVSGTTFRSYSCSYSSNGGNVTCAFFAYARCTALLL
jgi:hypothetical protein